ncbi:serine/threonine-protein kinase [Calothrix sp. PCC 6303]|uniref:serine/threonine-protein kinase n=1 Tax=Calothrix sp. PCC 6303 TaxID=1170562 RepID=UPI0002A001F0|nr:serine/threonine-protein kinase [Calothrix sp. PCC 6303]AFY99691.1 serine/threonine protein kinase [Calothrix sp. PCC 6303]
MLLNNRYRVIQTLGSGGFGDTFLAEDTQMPSQRRCVVKQLKPIQNNAQIYQLVQERFQREAAILEELGGNNEQIPTLYAYFPAEGKFYLVQEWVEGQTLTTAIQQRGLFAEATVREILLSLLPVLDFVHSRGIVHRDIKPDNIIIRNRDQKPVLIDFGAVRETMGTAVNSQGMPTSSIVIGTPGFMPSEQAMGRPIFASDIYSLGITAVYLLTGRQPQELPTDSRTAEIEWKNYAGNIQPNLAAVIDKSIAYHPRDRFTSAREMLNALNGGFAVAPTVPVSPYNQSYEPTKPPASIPQNTIPSNQGNYQQYPTLNQPPANQPHTVPVIPQTYKEIPKENSNRGVLIGSVIIGSLIASGIIIAATLQKQPLQTASQSVISSTPEDTPPVESKTNQQTSTNSSKSSNSSNSPSTEVTRKPQIIQTPIIINSPNISSTIPTRTATPEPSPIITQTAEPDPVDISEKSSPTDFIQGYYTNINNGNLQTAWNQLSPSVQDNSKLHPNGYVSYTEWWAGTVKQVEINRIQLIDEDRESATVDARLNYILRNGKSSPSAVRLTLIWDATSNKWLVSDAKSLRG